MAAFDPLSGLVGGALIGLAAVMLMLLTGRIAGISGIVSGVLTGDDRAWRIAFLAGLIAAPLLIAFAGTPMPMPELPGGWLVTGAAGLLVGFGSRLGGGCTSGHGICGIARLSPRSITATVVFIATAMLVVALVRHL